MNNLIYRSIGSVNEINDRTVRGLAIVVNSWSEDLGGFREIIRPEALNQELLDRSDIIMNVNHDSDNYMMARNKRGKGSLNLNITQRGLEFEFEAPNTEKGNELLYHLRTGNLDACSFAFTLPKEGGQRWYRENGEMRREITAFEYLADCAIVAHPAYSATSCCARDKQDLANAIEQEEMRKAELEEKLDAELNELDSSLFNI